MKPLSGSHILVGAIVIVIVAAVATGVSMLGPPSEERARRLDERRVASLSSITYAVHLFHMRHDRLPPTLEELTDEPGVTLEARDPVSGAPYGYRVVDGATYELCAVFDRESGERRGVGFWSHDAGRQCFTLKAEETR